MAANYNRVIIAGNLTRDPQTRYLTKDRAVANFGLAVNRRWRGQDGQTQEETTFVDIEAWGRTAELVSQYLTKGRSALIEGRLKLDTWTDKETGAKRSQLRVVADSVQFLAGAAGDQRSGAGEQPAAQGRDASPPTPPAGVQYDDDEPPF
jgi:single-strand DNA-binding protein